MKRIKEALKHAPVIFPMYKRLQKTAALVETFNLKPNLIKIDVEGAEYFVLSGMHVVLDKHRPTILFEEHPDMQPPGVVLEQVEQLLARHGYAKRSIAARHSLWQPAGAAGEQSR